MSGTIAAAKGALFDLLVALHAADTETVEVIYGSPDAEILKLARVVCVGAVRPAAEGPDALDNGTAEQRYTIEITTSVDIPVPGSAGQRAATEAVCALQDRQEAAVREYVTGDLGQALAGVLGARPVFTELLERESDRGRTAAVRWGVQVIGQRQ